MTRQMLGGSADATQADPERCASRFEELRAMFELMKSDHDRALQAGELAVLPDTGHLITPAAVQTTIEFFERL
jgi:hypothetical protein